MSHLLFQTFELHADSRLRAAQVHGCAGEAAQFRRHVAGTGTVLLEHQGMTAIHLRKIEQMVCRIVAHQVNLPVSPGITHFAAHQILALHAARIKQR